MAKPVIDYVVIYGMTDSPDSPSSVARRTKCTDPDIYKMEICTPKSAWENSNTVARHFMGFESNSEPVPEKVAMFFVESWRDSWAQPKFQTSEKDLK